MSTHAQTGGSQGGAPPPCYKLILVGNSGTGKSALMAQFTDGEFPRHAVPTIGVDFKIHMCAVDGREVKLLVYDTAGSCRFRTITNSYYRSADGVLVVYDVTDAASFRDVPQWLSDVKARAPERVPVVLVGNKADLAADSRAVPAQPELPAHCALDPLHCVETSAHDREGVRRAFECLVREVMARAPKRRGRCTLAPYAGSRAVRDANSSSCCS